MENRIIYGADAQAYHRDALCEGPSLSSHIAHKLVTLSPAHAWEAHPKLGGRVDAEDEATADAEDDAPSRDAGTILHALVLGRGQESIAVVQADSFRTKLARELKAAAEAEGKVAIVASKFARHQQAAYAIKAGLLEHDIELDPAQSEVVLLWTERADDGTEVQCRGMVDNLVIGDDAATIYDLKTGKSSHPRALGSRVYSLGADIQRAAYVSGLAKIRPDLAGRIDYLWLFAEQRPPHAVTPGRATGEMRALGDQRWRRAVNMWARCFKDGYWPSYTEGGTIVDVEPPTWAMAEELEKQLAEPPRPDPEM